ERQDAVGAFEAVDGRDVGMVQRREDFGLALKTQESFGIRCESLGQHLERDRPLQIAVDRTIDFAHTTRADPGGKLRRAEAGTRRQRHDMTCEAERLRLYGQARHTRPVRTSTARSESAAVL